MSYAIYRASFIDGADELVKAESWNGALGLIMSSWPSREINGLEFVRPILKTETAEPAIFVKQ